MKLNLGCGDYQYDDYINIDSLLDARVHFKGERRVKRSVSKGLLQMKEWADDYDGIHNFIVGDAFRLPFKDEVFEKIKTARFLGRGYDRKNKMLHEAFRVLKPGGVLMMYNCYSDVFCKQLGVIYQYCTLVNTELEYFESEDLVHLHIECIKQGGAK